MKSLKHTRKAKGISLRDLETQTGIFEGTLSLIENGRQVPSLNMRKRIFRVFEGEINWLDTPSIIMRPRRKYDWLECEVEFRRLLSRIGTLPEDERTAFIKSACKYLKNIN